MNLPVVLFNTKKGKRKQKHKQQSRLAFIETVDTSNQETTGPLLECATLVTTIFLSHPEEALAKRKKRFKKKNKKPFFFFYSGANDRTGCKQMLNILRGGC